MNILYKTNNDACTKTIQQSKRLDSAEKPRLDETIPEINFINQIVKYIQVPLKKCAQLDGAESSRTGMGLMMRWMDGWAVNVWSCTTVKQIKEKERGEMQWLGVDDDYEDDEDEDVALDTC
ncbi:hypothetical protein [Anaerobiospirillum sp. NML120449]|uniref:hypothetical protein n=1 Tax=Anaerobiospirillum sp. NML120449 TaxID=2932817 RepID=UPI001FF156BA|nr:hypothetical protein [Anaerobiospirillum sp. NML120449]MCK0526296.1 hypothetical protein [Anaerobiospirillum sp. NML120449]